MAIGLVCICQSMQAQQLNVRTITREGDPILGAGPGEFSRGEGYGEINDQGDVAFVGAAGPPVGNANVFVYVCDRLDGMRIVAAQGDGSSGGPSTDYLAFDPRILPNGKLTMSVRYGDTPFPYSGVSLLTEENGSLTTLFDGPYEDPFGVGATSTSSFGISAMSPSSDVVMTPSWYIEPDRTYALAFGGTTAPLDVILTSNDPYPVPGRDGLQAGNPIAPVINAQNQIALVMGTALVVREPDGTYRELAYRGEPAPFVDPAAVWDSSFDNPSINNAGQVAWSGQVKISSTDRRQGIFIGDPVIGTVFAVQQGDQAPGCPAGQTFNSLGRPLINRLGQVAFWGSVTGSGVDSSNNLGIWVVSPDGDSWLVARKGDQAPGTPAGVTIAAFDDIRDDFYINFNGVGQVVFGATLAGPGVDSTNVRALFMTDRNRTLRLVARQGDLFDIDDSPDKEDLREIGFRSISPRDWMYTYSGGEDGLRRILNDAGELVITLEYADAAGTSTFAESGLFVVSFADSPRKGRFELPIPRVAPTKSAYGISSATR